LQATANRKHVQAPVTWDAINSVISQSGGPHIGYDEFNARWENEPHLKALVDRFDGRGLVVKTDQKPQMGHGSASKNLKAQSAMAATKRTDKA
jgi:hypothetical protein